ncbi:MAG: UDP-N-acetylmuramoyl-tripeptide--D-alanyl-D-alanine ligase [Glaciecola sp. HTCC2999]|nr:MAG: UDP-N-acetylmuramoyl-tripeptide--D-alanyl-D-alanine ligase [Glaciecola sp. HTCC2999]
MIKLSLTDIAKQLNGTLEGDDLIITHVSTDTRDIVAGSLFIALVGPNFNGHVFANEARQKGAVAIVASEPVDAHLPVIMVADTKAALGTLGAFVKERVAPKTVGITGSSGKTTVKEMVTAILQESGSVLSTQGNFNNDIGVPLTLLRLEEQHEYAVIEMGANHLGEIAYTTGLVKPDVATIVNAAASHLEGFGSLFGVARAKSEIFKGLAKDGTAILNYDSQFYDFWLGKLDNEFIYSFSLDTPAGAGADYTASQVGLAFNGCAHFIMQTPMGEMNIELTIPGMHNVSNALLAAGLAINVGASLENVRDGLSKMQHVKGRLDVKQLSEQVRLLDDSYNANVASVTAAIKLLSSYQGRRVLVLGDMAELGDKAKHYHEEVGALAKNEGIDILYTLGQLSQSASEVYGQAGQHFHDIDLLIEELYQELTPLHDDITILVKGSRSSRMDRVVTALEGSPVGKLDRSRKLIAC